MFSLHILGTPYRAIYSIDRCCIVYTRGSQLVISLSDSPLFSMLQLYGVTHLHQRRSSSISKEVKSFMIFSLTHSAIKITTSSFNWKDRAQTFPFFICNKTCLESLPQAFFSGLTVLSFSSEFMIHSSYYTFIW